MNSNYEKEIQDLKECLLKKERDIERKSKNPSMKTWMSLIIIISSAFYYIKTTKDQNINEIKQKTQNDLMARDVVIGELNTKLELMDRQLKSTQSECKLKDKTIDDFVIQTKITDQTIETLIDRSVQKDKRIDDLINEIQVKNTENDRLIKGSDIAHVLSEARDSTAKMLYSANDSRSDEITSVAKQCLHEELLYCNSETLMAEFDIYRTCYRELSVLLHRKLMGQLGSHWLVTIGSVRHCFAITNFDADERGEYLFTFGDIYFEIIEYKTKTIDSHLLANESNVNID